MFAKAHMSWFLPSPDKFVPSLALTYYSFYPVT
jgi:hypothetical protein